MLRNLLTVDHHERTKRVLTSDAEALQPCVPSFMI